MSGVARLRTATLCLAVVAVSVAACLLAYLRDNKYTADSPQAEEGLLVLSEEELAAYPVLFLIEGWEYYGGCLLSPTDFAAGSPRPDAYIYIGQYGGFEAGGSAASPHGSASYRLRLALPEAPRTLLLEMPEVFSAYRLYVNGAELAAMGEPDPLGYRAETGNLALRIEAQGTTELLIAVSDFSHLYSGLVYPPTLGQPLAVSRLQDSRLVLRGLIVAFALAVGLLSALIGLFGGGNRSAVLYGLLCLSFVGFTCYPILRTLNFGHPALNTIEMFSFCAMLIVVMVLQNRLYGRWGRWSHYVIGCGALMCLFSALLPLLLPRGSLAVMAAYSLAISAYELLTAAFITASMIRALATGQPHSQAMLCGFLAFDTALVMDRVLPLYEPIVGGWFYELASFVLVLCIGIAVGQEVAAGYKEGVVLAERQEGMERLAQMQKTSYELLMEKVEETKAIRHDLRHHFITIGGFVGNREYDKLGSYLAEYGATVMQDEALGYTRNVVADVLLRHYAKLTEQHRIEFAVQAGLGRDTGIADVDLCAILANLLENAVEACLRISEGRRFISVVLVQQKQALSIEVKNSAEGAAAARNGGGFLSVKAEGRTGYGLASVTAIARRYDGAAEFAFDEAAKLFRSTVFLIGDAAE